MTTDATPRAASGPHMRFCKDCAHVWDGWGTGCNHPALLTHDPVKGPQMARPHDERKTSGRCGPDALFFEAPAPSLFTRVIKGIFK